jgi:hypothetical protein
MPKHSHNTQVHSTADVGKMVLSKIVDPLTVIRLTVLHDDAGERLWGTMLAMNSVYIELVSRTSHRSTNQDSSHSHITTVRGDRVRGGGVMGGGWLRVAE